jgi:hypothetical protein
VAGAPYAATAFDGMAQRLVSPGSFSNVSAVVAMVAMQFDLDSRAAVSFSRKFYETLLLKPDIAIDEAVTEARSQIAAQLTMGSPSWANPVLYWRCKNGRPFDVARSIGPTRTPEDDKRIAVLRVQIDAYRNNLQELTMQPAGVQAAAVDTRQWLVAKIEGFQTQIGEIMGNAIRLKGGQPDENNVIVFVLTAKLRARAKIDTVRVKISFEEQAFEFVSVAQGAAASRMPLSGADAGVLEILLEELSAGAVWQAGEYEIAKFRMKVRDRLQSSRVLTIFETQVVADPDTFYSSLDGYAFLT